jgi:hypothetical protein
VNLQQRLNRACTIAIDSPPEAYAAEALAVFVAWLREQTTADAVTGETCYEWRKDKTGVMHGRHVAEVGLAWLAELAERGEL